MRRSLILSILIILALGGCILTTPMPATPTAPAQPTATRVVGITSTPALKVTPTVTSTVQCAQIGGKLARETTDYSITPGSWYVPRQLLLTGLKADIDKAVKDLGWERLREVDHSYLQKYVKVVPEGSPWQSYDGLVTRLYDTHDPVEQSLAKFLQQPILKEVRVFADPNRVLDFSVPARQWSVEGSPFAVPTGLGGNSAAAQEIFWNQWAFTGTFGIASGQKLRLKERTVKATGAGVTIAVFDTSPFEVKDLPNPQITWVDPPPRLCVSHPVPVPAIANTGQHPDLRDHGLFVAGLAYGVAPESDIHLIRVLNDSGLGHMLSLIEAGNLFAQQTLQAKGTLQGTVINLSLGFADPKGDDLSRLYDARMPATSMKTWIAALHSLGAVVVASAGNDSYENVSAPENAQAPAGYGAPDVIGVAASNQKGQRACYSNRGAIAAPGGDGVPTVTGQCGPGSNLCSQASNAKDAANCGEGLVSLALPRPNFDAGYAFWIGTSFAAPLVSGTVALGISSSFSPSPFAPPNGLKVISGTASNDLGLGIISVP